MTDQMISADKVREVASRFRDQLEPHIPAAEYEVWERATEAVEALLLPTLADMAPEERSACQWMQADIIGGDEPLVITRIDWTDGTALILDRNGRLDGVPAKHVTPRPDLPRMTWPGPDQDGEEATKVDCVPVAGGRTAYGPWTVARLRKKADTTPALPDGWRLADHPGYGRVLVTTPEPNCDGDLWFIDPSADPGSMEQWCDPDVLTFLEQ